MIVTSIVSDSTGNVLYLVCNRITTSGIAETNVQVALPHDLRVAARPATYMTIGRPYAVGATLMASQPIGGTDDQPRTWIDLNIAARRWSTSIAVCISGANDTLLFPSHK